MKVLVTGPVGFIGSAVVRELTTAGHTVTGLLRSADRAPRLRDELGGEPLFGDLGIPASYRPAALEHDVLVHTAFQTRGDTIGADRTALDALLDAARVGDRPRLVIYTSGCWVVGDTGGAVVDESASTGDPAEIVSWRPRHEQIALEAADDQVTTAVIRPGMVYGGSGGLTGHLFRTATEKGAAEYVASGEQHWSLVHREDLARLYRRVAEETAGGIFHGVDGRPLPAGEVAHAASEAAGGGGSVRSLPLEDAREKMGGVADALAMDQRLSTTRSRELGWEPTRASFAEAAAEAFGEWRAARDGGGGATGEES